MKTNWTKILVVLLTLTMILSLAACGPKDPPAESTPEQTTPQATPEASTPEATPNASTPEASTPEASTPEASTPNASTPEASTPNASTPEASTPKDTETGKESGKVSTPEDTAPVDGRPTEPTIETGTTEKGNWIFEIDKSTTGLKVDGLVDAAYYKGVYLVAEISLPADSESTFDLFIAADDTHIYVIYEFTKAEQIFYDATYEKLYHLDCVDFVLSLTGIEGKGAEFRILAGVEGGKDKAVVDTDLASKGVDDWYVKYTDKGYNVEFSIPLDAVRGTDKNGDKMISFTALSTITTAWEDKSGAPTRTYPVACKAAGAEDKDNPTFLVVKGTKSDEATTIEKTEDGRYKYTLNAATETLAQDGVKDAAYEKGLQFKGTYYSNSAIALEYSKSETNDYTMYIAADAEYIWVFFEVKDDAINTECPNYWHNDCVELFYNKAGNAKWNEEGYGSSLRVWAEGEGTDLIGKAPAEGEVYPFKSHKIDDAAGAITNHKPFLNSYTLKFVEGGYNVELTLKRSELKDKNVFSFLGVVTMAKDTANRTYVYTDNANGLGDNPDKDMLNQVVIVDAEKPVEPTIDYTKPTYKTEAGNNVYEITKAEAALTVDGVKDAAYADGTVLKAEFNLPESGSYFNIYFKADETHLYVLYEFVKKEEIFYWEGYSSTHHFDCADFIINLGGAEAAGTELHILGGVEGGKGTAIIKNDPAATGADDWYVKHTEQGYNVEISYPLEKITGFDAKGDKKLSFTAIATITYAKDGGDGKPARVYAFVGNGQGITNVNDARKAPNLIVIKDTAPDVLPPMTEDGRYTYTLNATKAALAVDGVKDDAYANGLSWDAIYQLPTEEEYGFTVYMAADANFVYVLYVVKDNKIVGADNASAWYRGDCIDFLFGPNGEAKLANDMRIFGDKEGGMGTADARNVYAAVKDLYVKTTDIGYNVEFKLDRSTFADSKVFSFLAMSGACRTDKAETGTTSTTVYPCIDNASGNGSNGGAKDKLNEVKIVDLPAETEDGRYTYTLNAAKEALTVDGVMDAAYANGLKFDAKYNLPTDEEYGYTVYMAADANFVYVLYVIKDKLIVGQADASKNYRADCADFILSTGAKATEGTGADMRIFGNIEGAKGTADATGVFAAVTELFVKHTDIGYNVEFKIDRAQFANKNLFSFLAMSGACRTKKAETGDTSTTVYPCIENAAEMGGNDAKGKLNEVKIVDAE